MRYLVLATDYDGTLADQGCVSENILNELQAFKAAGRRLILVTGREMKDLVEVFPDYKIIDYIVAENGALLHEPATGKEQLLGPPPDPSFVQALQERGVHPLSVGKVIIATWEPHEKTVLEVIKASGSERQVIFNKGAVMILPPGVNKATGLQKLLHSLHLSVHNVVAIGDAENDGALLQVAEFAAAVSNALPGLKSLADRVTEAGHGLGVVELIHDMLATDLKEWDRRLTRHYLHLGELEDGSPFLISPYCKGVLLAGASGSGKTTFTLSIVETMIKQDYQFCLIDPEGDYLQLPGAVVIGNDKVLPPMEEIRHLLIEPAQNVVICTLAIPLADRPAFFAKFLTVFLDLRKEFGHPHWLLLDEAHHLVPGQAETLADKLPEEFNNFIIISTSPHQLSTTSLSRVGTVIAIGRDAAYPFRQFSEKLQLPMPAPIPDLSENEIAIWNREEDGKPVYKARFHLPVQLQQRHKKKYAQGDMGYNSFIFTGPENKMHLKANNLMLFAHIAEGIDAETWLFHLHRKDFSRWFRDTVHDEELSKVGEEAEGISDTEASKKHILSYISTKYTA
ncbi:HAD-IIB family hydrolase [Flavitalea sp. BT771]|uniref:HAD-IIB family hydrolase n=1 Tax=Flavitalea sp. BT771 TaxID=3063329 RepID=UPI0026E1DCBA|nr:HAD-IIB family hydrolase [Flavitalea sp. BT771]MDO6430551.1 HAD-IIB family hydrolase [Flavitalea sp. BT771]MDV6219309.1 HAD-IIB family hydrolase [Flavitalea sp. BT771]